MGDKIAEEFIQKTDELFNLLKAYPAMGQIERMILEDFNFPHIHKFFTELEMKK